MFTTRHSSFVTRHFSAVLLCAALAGCAVAPLEPAVTGPDAECREVFRRVDEAALVQQTLPRFGPDARVTLRLAAGTHYLERIMVGANAPGTAFEYAFVDDDALRSGPLAGGGRRSVFRSDGIVPGTERGERWLFWPMGVPEPGAMRQWGRHPTAFVGRRHFDDPDLLERYFILKGVIGE